MRYVTTCDPKERTREKDVYSKLDFDDDEDDTDRRRTREKDVRVRTDSLTE